MDMWGRLTIVKCEFPLECSGAIPRTSHGIHGGLNDWAATYERGLRQAHAGVLQAACPRVANLFQPGLKLSANFGGIRP